MDRELFLDLQSTDLNSEESLTKGALKVKELERDNQGVFDFTQLDTDVWKAAAVIYPIYTKYETSINKKAGYPDIMAQMRVLKQRAYADFIPCQVVGYMEMLIGTVETISPEIYENYRELVEDFRETFHRVKGMDLGVNPKLAEVLERAFVEKVLLREKYEKFAKALKGQVDKDECKTCDEYCKKCSD